jgi:hypothetical protein
MLAVTLLLGLAAHTVHTIPDTSLVPLTGRFVNIS